MSVSRVRENLTHGSRWRREEPGRSVGHAARAPAPPADPTVFGRGVARGDITRAPKVGVAIATSTTEVVSCLRRPRGAPRASLRQWSEDVVLLSNGPHGLAAEQCARVEALAIPVVETPVAALEGDDQGRLRRVRLDDGETLDRDALFFYVGWQLRNDLARRLGCRLRDDGSIAVDSELATTVDRCTPPATAPNRGRSCRRRPARASPPRCRSTSA
jgi:Pyridine nucleotide-disulphide oxidoreductase